MENPTDFFANLYRNFNERKIEPVIDHMTSEVKWANGMEGGYVYGHEGVREYWTRQFSLVNPKVEPIEIHPEGSKIRVRVHQVVHDLDHNLLADDFVEHFFQFDGDKINLFEIGK